MTKGGSAHPHERVPGLPAHGGSLRVVHFGNRGQDYTRFRVTGQGFLLRDTGVRGQEQEQGSHCTRKADPKQVREHQTK